MKPSVTLFQEIDKISEFLVNRRHPAEEIEFYYEFCYNILMKARNRDESCKNPDLLQQLLDEDLSKIYLALYGMVFGKNETMVLYWGDSINGISNLQSVR